MSDIDPVARLAHLQNLVSIRVVSRMLVALARSGSPTQRAAIETMLALLRDEYEAAALDDRDDPSGLGGPALHLFEQWEQAIGELLG